MSRVFQIQARFRSDTGREALTVVGGVGRVPGARKSSPVPYRGIVKEAANPWYEVTLTEGRNRQIRRMFEAVGHHVEKIKRVKYGPLTLDVPPGEF